MKIVKISVPDEVWEAARREAARHNTTLSGLVRRCLEAMAQGTSPTITEETRSDADQQNRLALLQALQSANLILGYTPSRAKTFGL